MTNKDFLEMAKTKVWEYEHSRGNNISLSDIYIVWSCKTLQNSKALISGKQTLYYEFTLNGDKNEFYMDVYSKTENICFDSMGNKNTLLIR